MPQDPPALQLHGSTTVPWGATAPRRVDLNSPIPEGTRNNTLYTYGVTLKRDGLGDGSIREALYFVNIKRCTPPLPDDEVDAIAGSVAKSNAKRGELREYEQDSEVGVLMSDVESEEVRWLCGVHPCHRTAQLVNFSGDRM